MYYCMWCSALVVLAMVVWSWNASCVHCVKVTVTLFYMNKYLFNLENYKGAIKLMW